LRVSSTCGFGIPPCAFSILSIQAMVAVKCGTSFLEVFGHVQVAREQDPVEACEACDTL
jgi:hypothetical protein